jgi:hypothetical protein
MGAMVAYGGANGGCFGHAALRGVVRSGVRQRANVYLVAACKPAERMLVLQTAWHLHAPEPRNASLEILLDHCEPCAASA